MAAWYNMSAMGLYQVCPGEPVYQISSPIFDKVTISLDNSVYKGKEFVIIANNLSKDNIYIQSAKLNNREFNRSWINHDEIVKGGTLIFEMGSEPATNWGTDDK